MPVDIAPIDVYSLGLLLGPVAMSSFHRLLTVTRYVAMPFFGRAKPNRRGGVYIWQELTIVCLIVNDL